MIEKEKAATITCWMFLQLLLFHTWHKINGVRIFIEIKIILSILQRVNREWNSRIMYTKWQPSILFIENKQIHVPFSHCRQTIHTSPETKHICDFLRLVFFPLCHLSILLTTFCLDAFASSFFFLLVDAVVFVVFAFIVLLSCVFKLYRNGTEFVTIFIGFNFISPKVRQIYREKVDT